MTTAKNTVDKRIRQLLQQMSAGIYERDYVLAMTLLTAIAGESIFLLGLPGVGKSLISRRLKLAFRNAKSFEYLMSRFSTPDEIFGPVSIARLKDEGVYERIVDGYLPDADVVFLDEIWKAGPSIQNTLLTVLNEKIFHNGSKNICLPLKGIIAASNELPAKNEGLEALWDRFIIRLIVPPLESREAFEDMITATTGCDTYVNENLQISDDEYLSLSKRIDAVIVPQKVLDTIDEIRRYLRDPKEHSIYVSDRRWKKIIRLLRTAALLEGRTEVIPTDCFITGSALWSESEHIDTLSNEIDRIVVNTFLNEFEAEYIELSRLRDDIHKELTSDLSKNDIPASKFRIIDGQYYNIIGYSDSDLLINRKNYDDLVPFVVQYAVLSDDRTLNSRIVTPDKSISYSSDKTVAIAKTKGGLQINNTFYPIECAEDEMLQKYFPEIYSRLTDIGLQLDDLLSRLKEFAKANFPGGSSRPLFINDSQLKKCRSAISRLQLRIRKLKNLLYVIKYDE